MEDIRIVLRATNESLRILVSSFFPLLYSTSKHLQYDTIFCLLLQNNDGGRKRKRERTHVCA